MRLYIAIQSVHSKVGMLVAKFPQIEWSVNEPCSLPIPQLFGIFINKEVLPIKLTEANKCCFALVD